MSYAALEKQIRLLPEECLDEVSNYIEYILFRRMKEKKSEKKDDLRKYYGSLVELPDGLELQRSLRDEWD